MRTNKSPESARPELARPKSSADVYDFGEARTASGRRRRIKVLQHENALLSHMVSELGVEIVRVRKMLAGMTNDSVPGAPPVTRIGTQ